LIGLSEVEIERLIACPKAIAEPPKAEMTLKNRSYRNDMKVVNLASQERFTVFLRKSEEFEEDFSVGLLFHSAEGRQYMIYRCNGPHGETTEDFQVGETHYGYHEHFIVPYTNEMIPSMTTGYGSFHDAVAYFLKKCNVQGAGQYFKFLKANDQLTFDLGKE